MASANKALETTGDPLSSFLIGSSAMMGLPSFSLDVRFIDLHPFRAPDLDFLWPDTSCTPDDRFSGWPDADAHNFPAVGVRIVHPPEPTRVRKPNNGSDRTRWGCCVFWCRHGVSLAPSGRSSLVLETTPSDLSWPFRLAICAFAADRMISMAALRAALDASSMARR